MNTADTCQETIHFVLAANHMGALSRVTKEYANRLVRQGFRVIVSVPHFDYIDFVLWRLHRDTRTKKNRLYAAYRWLSWLVYPMLEAIVFRKNWYGQTLHELDEKVRVNRFWFLPWAGNMPDADWIVVFQCYFIPHLLYLPSGKGKIVGGIRLDYSAAANEPNEMVAEWRRYCNAFEQRLNVPLFACSELARRSARDIGIDTDIIIYQGVNLEEFTDGGRRGEVDPLRITMFCHDHPQKGQDFGCAVIRMLRKESFAKRLVFCSVGGNVKNENRKLFDLNYGYVTGRDYVKVYQDTDIFIFPSQYEGFPAPPLEAMACGCALATTRVSGVEEYAFHKTNCVIASPDDMHGMYENVKTLIQDMSFRDSIRENGLATVKDYSWEKSTDSLIEFLRLHSDQTSGDRLA